MPPLVKKAELPKKLVVQKSDKPAITHKAQQPKYSFIIHDKPNNRPLTLPKPQVPKDKPLQKDNKLLLTHTTNHDKPSSAAAA